MMATVTKAWDDLYASGQHISVWPWSDVVSLVMRHARPPSPSTNFRVIELGCGVGANIPFFSALGVDYHGIDASPTAITRLRDVFPHLAEKLMVGDFTASWPVDGEFDLVVDRAAITHNDMAGITCTFAEIRRRVKRGGQLVCVDLFSAASSEAGAGEPGPEKGTRVNFSAGPLAGTGLAHFFDETELRRLLAGFELVHLQHKVVTTLDQHSRDFSTWSFVATRL
jgi:SAM-dependent methyltransferase